MQKITFIFIALVFFGFVFLASCNNENNTFEIRATDIQRQGEGSIFTVKAKNHNGVVLAETMFWNNAFTLHIPNRLRNSLLAPMREELPNMGIRRNVRDTALFFYAYDIRGRQIGFFIFKCKQQEHRNNRVEAHWVYVNRDVIVVGTEKNEGNEEWSAYYFEVDLDLQRGWNLAYTTWKTDYLLTLTTQKPSEVTFNWVFVSRYCLCCGTTRIFR